jgi:DNA-directed RNA polymerase subunit RPC12/RpoP
MAKNDTKELKVKPGDKKPDEKDDVKAKAKLLILKHPEATHSARDLFHNENGKTIVEEKVPRGDVSKEDVLMPRNQSDLTDKDLRELAAYASNIIDPILKQYDERVAKEDALLRAIGSKDSGKYAGKVNASTFTLILDQMGKKKQASEEETPQTQQNKEESKEDRMNKETIKRELEATRKRLAALEVLAEDDDNNDEDKECECKDKDATSKEAAETFKCPYCGTKVLAKTGYCVKCKKKVKGGDKKEEVEDKEDKKEEKKASAQKTAMETIVTSLDEIAGTLENQNDAELTKIAFQIDMVSDVLEGKKEAATLEGDADEKFMKAYFHAGTREADKDEKYMGEFNTDTSTELQDKAKKNQLGKDASAMPYRIVQ